MPTPHVNPGSTLSPADIAALLKDPNSMLSRFYRQCLYAVALEQFKLHMSVLCATAEVSRYLAERQVDEDETSVAPIPGSSTTYSSTAQLPLGSVTSNSSMAQSYTLIGLKQEMTVLLAKDQSNMNLAQLVTHHQAITSNLTSQIAVQLGPTITLDSGKALVVPQPSIPASKDTSKSSLLAPLPPSVSGVSEPLPSTPSVLETLMYNPVLEEKVLADDKSQKAFAVTHTRFNLGPNAVFRMYNAILLANNITSLKAHDRKSLIHAIDGVIKSTNDSYLTFKGAKKSKNDNQSTLMQALIDNAERTLKAYNPELENTSSLKSILFSVGNDEKPSSSEQTNVRPGYK